MLPAGKAKVRRPAAPTPRGSDSSDSPTRSPCYFPQLVRIYEVEPWLRFNRFIRRGYRPCGMSRREALASLVLYVHNETFNVLSHWLPCAIFAYWAWYPPVPPILWSSFVTAGDYAAGAVEPPALHFFRGWTSTPTRHPADPIDPAAHVATPMGRRALLLEDPHIPTSMLSALCLSFCITFFLSGVYHLFMPCCRSGQSYQNLLQCDIFGVLMSISGSAYTYVVRGNPCVSRGLVSFCSVLMVNSSALVFYVLFIAPRQQLVGRWLLRTGRTLGALLGAGIASLYHTTTQHPLTAPPSGSQNFLWEMVWKGHCRYRRWQAGTSVHTDRITDTRVTSAECTACGAITAAQRVIILGFHGLLHFLSFVLIVLPKARTPHGYTQGAYYHAAAYVWLLMGSVINVTHVPERWLVPMATRAKSVERQWLEHQSGENMTSTKWVPEDQIVDGSSSRPRSGRPKSTCGAKAGSRRTRCADAVCWGLTNYIMGSRDVDIVGNSHNLWHVMTVMSTLCTLMGAYYDCIEYELMRC